MNSLDWQFRLSFYQNRIKPFADSIQPHRSVQAPVRAGCNPGFPASQTSSIFRGRIYEPGNFIEFGLAVERPAYNFGGALP